MASVITVCNMALGNIGITQTIENIDDNNERARMCKLYYEPLRDQLIRKHTPNFAQAVVALALVSGDPPPGWEYQYRYPTDCLFAKQLTDEDGARQGASVISESVWSSDAWLGLRLSQHKIPFEVRADPSVTGRIIVTDLEDAHLWYTKKVTDPNQFDPEFVVGLSWALASAIAIPLKVNPNIAQYATNMARGMMGEAQAGEQTEQQPLDDRMSPSISGRA